MSVPATSASRLAREFGPGTTYDPVNFRETPSGFGYLLGFEANIGNFQGTASEARDLAIPPSAAGIVDASTTVGRASLTGSQPNLERAGFEQIFDVVDIGPLSFGQRRWFDPYQTRGATSGMVRNDMFNRVVQTLHAPFNYVDRHRTPGKINLNTTPDYIRQGGGFESRFPVTNSDFQRPFTGGTAPSTPTVTAGLLSGIASQPTNHQVGTGSDPFNTAVLYGNGSVYQAITAGISSAYDLDDNAGEPVTLGQFNGHKSSTDSRFGFNFKNFVQSRRGYSTSLVNPAESWSQDKFFNVDLDYRYPSRFAGMFAPTAVATLPSTQLYLRMGTSDSHRSTLRRTHDMSLLRTNPDFDLRVMDATQRVNAQTPTMTDYKIGVETPTTSMAITMPTLVYAPNAAGINDSTPTTQVASLRMPLYSSGLFERTQADLHKDFRSLDRDPFFRFKNTAQLAGMTTHHSNVFMVRFTVGYFVVDPATGAIGEEYLDPRNGYTRPKGLYIVDRTIPVGYEPNTGFISTDQLNALDTVIFSSTN